ncbi:MAG: flagellar protein FliS, partial [Novosphingobium sp.]
MLALATPREAYRRVAFDARIAGAAPQELVLLCLDEFVVALGGALVAHDRRDGSGRSKALTRALAVLTTLQLGVDRDNAAAAALLHLYEAARRSLLDNAAAFDPARVAAIRQDFVDIAGALAPH